MLHSLCVRACASVLQEALRVDPKSAKACFRLGQALMQQQEYEDAQVYLDRALKLVPDDKAIAAALAKCKQLHVAEQKKQAALLRKGLDQ